MSEKYRKSIIGNNNSMNNITDMEKIVMIAINERLHQKGLITHEEYDCLKKEIISAQAELKV